jgi:hypothetical protein
LFDPTIFDNLKVVVEGAVYDKDLEGDIKVIDRRDIIDLANMSREYIICFQLLDQFQSKCTWQLSSTIGQLANELLASTDHSKSGCTTAVKFNVQLPNEEHEFQTIESLISSVWGDRDIEITVLSSLPTTGFVQMKLKIKFNRIILEEDIDDLMIMFDYMEKTLQLLQQNGY